MFGLGQIGRLGALASSVARAWSPLSLWPDGISSAGMWISPRDLTSQWQDYTGTTPVVTPGTVADSSNPVGLALDIRAGAPEVLGPDVVTNGDFAAGSTGWTLETDWSISGGQAHVTNASNIWAIYQAGLTPGKTYLISFTITSLSAGGLTPYCGDNLRDINANTVGTHTAIMVCGSNGFLGVRASSFGTTAAVDNISFREVPGNHMLQSTSAARPLMSARVNLLTYTENFEGGNWSGSGSTGADILDWSIGADKYQWLTLPANTPVRIEFDYSVDSGTDGTFSINLLGGASQNIDATPTVQRYSGVHSTGTANPSFLFGKVSSGTAFRVSRMSVVREADGALPYQAILTDGSSYSSTGFPIAQLYDGVDDGMATAPFAAGTLIDGMDCMIAVMLDSAFYQNMSGLYDSTNPYRWFGFAQDGGATSCVLQCGTPTVFVDGVQLSGGTAVTQGTLYSALTVGEMHILEFRDLDLSAWERAEFGFYGSSYQFNGARGDILLYPSTASTEDKDAARQYLADYYGVTLP